MHNLTLRNIKEDTAVRSQISQNSDSLSRNISTCYDIRSLGVQYRFLGHERYTECPGRNVPDFGKMFLKLKYTDLTKNTYIRSWTVTEIMAREKCGLLAVPRTVPGSRDVLPIHCICLSFSLQPAQARSCCDCTCTVLRNLRTTATLVRVFI